MRHLLVFVSASLFLAPSSQAQDINSGPEKGVKVPNLKVFDATGMHKDMEADYAANRKGKPTVYFFVNAEKFDRPMNRFMKTLDGIVAMDFKDVYIVAVWLTSDVEETKALLPRVQQSVQYEATALTLVSGDNEELKSWDVNSDAHLTAIIANKGKVTAAFGYQSINETDVPKVREALEKAIRGN